jgi:hypothetical protein
MYFNFNVYRGRKMFNLNFAAKNPTQAVADASKLVPKFMQLRWVLWSCEPGGRQWKRGRENFSQPSRNDQAVDATVAIEPAGVKKTSARKLGKGKKK